MPIITVKIKVFFLLFVLKKKTFFGLNHIYIKFYIKKKWIELDKKKVILSQVTRLRKTNMVNTVYIHL